MLFGQLSLPSNFITAESFASLGGSSAIVFVVSNTLQSVFNFNPKWFAFVLSLIVGVVGAAVLHHASAAAPNPSLLEYGLGLLNGFLIYLTAAGGTAVLASAGGKGNRQSGDGSPAPQPPATALLRERVAPSGAAVSKRGFLHPWF